MTDISNLITRARLIKNETVPSANTAERVGQLLEDIINTFASGTPERKTIRQVYDESGRLQVLFACNGSCVLKYSASVSGRSWSDELYYTSTSYPTADTFFTLTRQDFTESRYLGVPRGVCIPTKTVAVAPSIEFTFEVVYLKGSITWYDGDRLVSVSSEDIQCAKIATREDLSSAINLTTSAAGYIYNDQNEPVSSLTDNTLYTMNASANGGAFTIPARNDYAGTTIFCYGDGVATLNGTDYAYTSGQTLVLEGGVVHVEDTDNDYYTKAETDAQIATAVSGKAADNAVVHKTGDESVGGWKTLSTGLVVGNSGYIRFTPPGTAGASIRGGTNNTLTVEGGGIIASSGNILNNESRLVTGGKVYTVLLDYQTLANLVTALSSSSADTQYPSAKCVYDALAGKADDNGVVHKTGDESIAGTKSFTGLMKVGSGNSAIEINKVDSTLRVENASILRLQRRYSASERYIGLNVYGSVDGTSTYPRLLAQKVDNSGDEPATTETTSVALRDDRVGFASGRTTEWGYVNATSNGNANWATKEIPTKNAVSEYVSGQIAGKADDSGVVHTTGAETVGGAKTFSSAVALSASGSIVANNHQAVDGDTVKAYVDSHITDIVITLD